jgi:hypothetical protein
VSARNEELLSIAARREPARRISGAVCANALQRCFVTDDPLVVVALPEPPIERRPTIIALTEIWQRIKAPLLDSAARWVDETLRRMFSGYQWRYQRFMEQQHRFFDVKGLTTQGPYSLMLHQVFVDLSLIPQPAHQVGADPMTATCTVAVTPLFRAPIEKTFKEVPFADCIWRYTLF